MKTENAKLISSISLKEIREHYSHLTLKIILKLNRKFQIFEKQPEKYLIQDKLFLVTDFSAFLSDWFLFASD